MEKRRLGTTSIEASAVAVGCWPMGGSYWGGTDDDVSICTIHRALDLGATFFDTAPGYGNGHSEEVLGKGLKGRRHEAVISTKVPAAADMIRSSLEISLRRLQTDYVEMCFVHWPRRSEPMKATLETLEQLRHEGLIGAIGVSNFTIDMLEIGRRYATIDVLQPPYNLLWRFCEDDVVPYCCEHQIGITTYSSLAQGMLTGALRLNTAYPDGDMRPRSILWQSENLGKCLYTVERLRPIARDLGVTMAQLALRWLIEQPGVTTALVGARTPDEIEENAGAVGWDLPAEALAAVQEISDELYLSMPYYFAMWGNWRTWNKRGPQREE